MLRQHAVDDVFVNLDTEGPRDNQGNTWAAETRVAGFQLYDDAYEVIGRTFGSGFLRPITRREQLTILSVHQRLMKSQERRRLQPDGDFTNAAGAQE